MKPLVILLGGCLVSLGLFALGCKERVVVYEQPAHEVVVGDVVYVQEEPPPIRVERAGRPPSRNHLWLEGHWMYRDRRYVWERGHWEAPPHRGDVWVTGHWVKGDHGYHWLPGHWRQ
jgi:hypothetical protein